MSHPGTYYALQQAMSLGSKDPESQVYLLGLMDKLEQARVALAHVADWMWGGRHR